MDPRNKDFMCKRAGAEILLCGPRDGKVFLRYFGSCSKGCALEVECGGVWNLWLQAKILLFVNFVISSWGKQWEILLVAISECCL